jgi:hypothetical protein
MLCSQQRSCTTDLPRQFKQATESTCPQIQFIQAAEHYLDLVTPTVDALIAHSQWAHKGMTHSGSRRNKIPLLLNLTRAEQAAQCGVRSIVSSCMAEGKYGSMKTMKPDNTKRIMLKKIKPTIICLRSCQGQEDMADQ